VTLTGRLAGGSWPDAHGLLTKHPLNRQHRG
jgi:hypothetical protein